MSQTGPDRSRMLGEAIHRTDSNREPHPGAFASERTYMARAVHELRSPTAALAALGLSLTNRDQLSDAQLNAAFSLLGRLTEQLRHLVDELIDLGTIPVASTALTSTDLRRVVDDALDATVCPSHVRLLVDITPYLRVSADPFRLRQVLINLLSNAYHYGGDVILLTAEAAADGVILRVQDDGAGLPVEVEQHLFEPFVRGAAQAHGAGETGSGLGLAISYDLAETFGELSYERRGLWTTFSLRVGAAEAR